jgi:hypothetical protein
VITGRTRRRIEYIHTSMGLSKGLIRLPEKMRKYTTTCPLMILKSVLERCKISKNRHSRCTWLFWNTVIIKTFAEEVRAHGS